MSKVRIGGKERVLKLGTLAMSEIEAETKCNFFKNGGAEFFNDLQLRKIVTLVWAGLLHQDPDLQRSVAAGWIDEILEKENGVEILLKSVTEMVEESSFFAPMFKEQKKTSGKKSKPSA